MVLVLQGLLAVWVQPWQAEWEVSKLAWEQGPVLELASEKALVLVSAPPRDAAEVVVLWGLQGQF